MNDPAYYESLPLVDHAEKLAGMSSAERLFHIVNLANYRYNHSPEEEGESHSQSRGTMLNTVRNALVERGYPYSEVQEAINQVVHGNA